MKCHIIQTYSLSSSPPCPHWETPLYNSPHSKLAYSCYNYFLLIFASLQSSHESPSHLAQSRSCSQSHEDSPRILQIQQTHILSASLPSYINILTGGRVIRNINRFNFPKGNKGSREDIFIDFFPYSPYIENIFFS